MCQPCVYISRHVKIGAKCFQLLSVTNTWEVINLCNFIIKHILRVCIRETPLLCSCPDIFYKLFSPIPPEAKHAVLKLFLGNTGYPARHHIRRGAEPVREALTAESTFFPPQDTEGKEDKLLDFVALLKTLTYL